MEGFLNLVKIKRNAAKKTEKELKIKKAETRNMINFQRIMYRRVRKKKSKKYSLLRKEGEKKEET